jgi:hypothetical protein
MPRYSYYSLHQNGSLRALFLGDSALDFPYSLQSNLIINFFLLPETSSQILLNWKARGIRKATGDYRYIVEIEF